MRILSCAFIWERSQGMVATSGILGVIVIVGLFVLSVLF